ncbi:MAG: TetR/AcrR family transcriptional regulator [Rhodobacteraceae bacterium]|nr:TetR/AcrR family transcriptional regulator [Paracoccaceae bacterium]
MEIIPEVKLPQLKQNVRRYFQDKARQRPKKERTKAILLDGIVETIAQYGLGGTTIKEIIEVAGVSHGTFYNHFESRDEAIRCAASWVASEVIEKVILSSERPEKDDEAVVAAIYAFMAAAIAVPAWGKILSETVEMLSSNVDGSSEKLEEQIKRGVSNGVFRVSVTPLLSLQVRAIQALAIRTSDNASKSNESLGETCEAVLRLLGRTPDEARAAVKSTTQQDPSPIV